jgi:hypothetical protein
MLSWYTQWQIYRCFIILYWLRNCATSRKVAGSIPDGVIGNFQCFLPHYGPGVDSASNKNDYQKYFLGSKGGRCVRLTTLPPSYANCLEVLGTSTSWNPQGPSTLVQGWLYLLLCQEDIIMFKTPTTVPERTVFSSLESRICTVFSSLESRIQTAFSSLESRISTVFSSLKSRIRTVFSSLESHIRFRNHGTVWCCFVRGHEFTAPKTLMQQCMNGHCTIATTHSLEDSRNAVYGVWYEKRNRVIQNFLQRRSRKF